MQILFSKNRNRFAFIGLGILLGVNVFNNLEFGLTSSLSILIAAIILLRKTYSAPKLLVEVIIGLLLILLSIYALFLLMNKPLKLEELFLFIKLTLSGYYAIPMDAFGIHLIIVTFFITVGFISVYQLLNNPFSNSKPLKRNYLLFILSIWSIMTLPYFVGRSFPQQLSVDLLFITP